jgi:AbrB family looped-hinge helix DNA binding protein
MVTFNGRITLPPDVRKQLGLKTGDKVEFVEIGDGRFALAMGDDVDGEEPSESEDWMPKLAYSSNPQ